MNDKASKTANINKDKGQGKLALFCIKSHLMLWPIAIIGLIADLWTKQIALDSQIEGERQNIIGEWFYLTLAHNPGAAFSIASGKTAILIGFTLIAMGFVFWLFATSKPGQTMMHLSLGMIIGGALGNFHDRLFNVEGRVVDFIGVDLGFWPLHPWPTFNIADSLLCVGVGILMICMLKMPPEEGKEPKKSKK
ncbi:MAG: signal peptidase II [Phycisphaerae bacterium]|nr:signal peptidase II [Phycisphaerae bacterium]